MRPFVIAALSVLAACNGSPSGPTDDAAAGNDATHTSGDGSAQPDAGGHPDATAHMDATAATDAGGNTPHDAMLMPYDQVSPTPPGQWVSVTNGVNGLASECGNVSAVFSDPYADMLVVGVALNGLFASTDGAQTWTAIGTTGDTIKNRMSSIVWDPATHATFWESGIYGWETQTDGVFQSTNNGASFTGYAGLVTASNYGNTNDSVAIDFSDPQRQTMLAGTHETKNQLFLSTNGGTAWSDIGATLPAGLGFCTSTLVLSSTNLLVGCAASWSGEAGAIIRSTNGGAQWTSVRSSGVVGQPLLASDGTIYWSSEGGGMVKSTDDGATWTAAGDANATGGLRPLELPDGRIVSTQGQSIVISADHGATWTTIGMQIPFAPNGLEYSPFRNAFYASYFTCTGTDPVPSDSISRFGWDYRTN